MVIDMNKWLRRCLLIFFSAVFLVSGFMIAKYYIDSSKQNTQFDELANLVQQAKPQPTASVMEKPTVENSETAEPAEPTEPQPLPEYVEVAARNPDMAGWLAIADTRINYPVMYAPDEEDKYLHRDFYGKYSGHGCLYVQEECSVDPPSDNITIYGHNMKDGSMFAGLLSYANKSFWEKHRYITFDTLMEHHTYEVFAVFRTTASKGKGFAYHRFIDAQDAEKFQEFVKDCQLIALYDTGITPQYGDKLITLSTCEYSQQNGRFVVVARRID